MRVLVAEDDSSLGEFLKRGLELQGYEVEWVADGEAALEKASEEHPDLVLLDLSLPRRDGMEVLSELRARQEDCAVLVLTGRSGLKVRVECLDLGADDCLLKPFSYFELTARCRAVLRRRRPFAGQVLRHRDLELDRVEHRVTRAGRTVALTAKEFALLECLMLHRGECVSRTQLLAQVWQAHAESATNIVDVYVNYLRRKVQAEGESGLIQAVRGVGYRMSDGNHSEFQGPHTTCETGAA